MEERSGPSPVWDAIDRAIEALQSQSTTRRSVIAVTDGWSTGNAVGFGDVVMRAVGAGVSVSVVHPPAGKDAESVSQSRRGEVRLQAEPVLMKLVDETGGLFRYAGEGLYANPEPHVEKIIRWLHEGYVLGFSAPVHEGKMHKLDIRVKRPGLVVLARKVFMAPVASTQRR